MAPGSRFIVDHAILVMGWVLFGVCHSLLAAAPVKTKLHRLMGRYFRYYPLLYSLFAFVTITLLLVWQFTMHSVLLWQTPLYLKMGALITLSAGLVIMMVTCKGYFVQHSGIQVFRKEKSDAVLLQKGLHRFVRHPLYAGTILFVWSLLVFFPMLHHLLACVLLTIYTLIGIQLEEKKLLQAYGATYRHYQQQVPMIIPFAK